MIRRLRVNNILAGDTRHVALLAVGLVGVMFAPERGAMTCETFVPVIRDFFFRRRSRMRIVTARARHRISRLTFAHALGKCFRLAQGAQTSRAVIGKNKVMREIREIVARLKLVQMFAGLLDGHVSFQMTLHADIIPTGRSEFRRIDDRATF